MQKMFTINQVQMLASFGSDSFSTTSVDQCMSPRDKYTLKTLVDHNLVEKVSLFGVPYFRLSLQGIQLLSLKQQFKTYGKSTVWAVRKVDGMYHNYNSK